MIDAQVLQRLATQYHTTTVNVAREYCQHMFLSSFYQRKGTERVLFKGGTALRVIYGSPRFSEDLDFSGMQITKSSIEDLLTETFSAMERVGMAVEIEEAKATSGGYLSIVHGQFLSYHVEVQLQISLRRGTRVHPETALIASDLWPAYTLLHLPQEHLVQEKLDALLDRGKPRDFYDLYFILRKGLLSPRHRGRLSEVLVRLKQRRHDPFDELRLFLPRDQQAILRDFGEVLAVSTYITFPSRMTGTSTPIRYLFAM